MAMQNEVTGHETPASDPEATLTGCAQCKAAMPGMDVVDVVDGVREDVEVVTLPAVEGFELPHAASNRPRAAADMPTRAGTPALRARVLGVMEPVSP
jgi:hypothetical protein